MSGSDARSTHSPGTVLSVAAVVAAIATTGITAGHTTLALVAGGVGVLGIAAGLAADDRRVVAFGGASTVAAVAVAGAAAAPIEYLLPSAAAALLAWEFSLEALAIEDELAGGTVERTELLHVIGGTTVGALGSGGVYALDRVVTAGVSPVAVILLVIATIALGVALRE